MLKIIPFLLLIIACGHPNKVPHYGEIQDIIDNFRHQYDLLLSIPIEFASIEAAVVGRCTIDEFGNSKITVDPSYWDELNQNQKEIVIFHELAHCIFYILDHNNKTFEDGCPKSIMKSIIFTAEEADECYGPNKEYYYEEIDIMERNI